jgi:hypothetical protein
VEKATTIMAKHNPHEAQPAARTLPPAAQRALAEAEERRRQAAIAAANKPQSKERNGPKGLEPTRYGDWEKKGIASDF